MTTLTKPASLRSGRRTAQSAVAGLEDSGKRTDAPKRKRRDSRIAEILDAARHILETRQMADFTIAEVARLAEVSEATVFGYFGSRRELTFRVISNWMTPVADRLEVDLQAIDTSRARLHFFVLRHLHELASSPGMHRLIYRELHWDDYYGSVLHRLNQRYTRLVIWILEEGKRIGDIRKTVDCEIARDQIFGTLQHVGWRSFLNDRPLDLQTLASSIVGQIFDGLEVRRSATEMAHLDRAIARLERLAGGFESRAGDRDAMDS